MGSVLVGKGVTSARHDDDGCFWSVSEESVHADGRFFEDGAFSDGELLLVVEEDLADFEMVEVLEDCGGVTNDKKFVFERLVNAGNSSRHCELMIDELDIGDGCFELNGGDFEGWVAGGVNKRGGLETDK